MTKAAALRAITQQARQALAKAQEDQDRATAVALADSWWTSAMATAAEEAGKGEWEAHVLSVPFAAAHGLGRPQELAVATLVRRLEDEGFAVVSGSFARDRSEYEWAVRVSWAEKRAGG